jgi:hypothetical protein
MVRSLLYLENDPLSGVFVFLVSQSTDLYLIVCAIISVTGEMTRKASPFEELDDVDDTGLEFTTAPAWMEFIKEFFKEQKAKITRIEMDQGKRIHQEVCRVSSHAWSF